MNQNFKAGIYLVDAPRPHLVVIHRVERTQVFNLTTDELSWQWKTTFEAEKIPKTKNVVFSDHAIKSLHYIGKR